MSEPTPAPDEFARKQLGSPAVGSTPAAGPAEDVGDDLSGPAPLPPAGSPGNSSEKRFVRLPCEDYNLSNFAAEVGAILNKNGIFRRDDMIVTVNRDRGALVPMDHNRFCTYVEKTCTPAKFYFDRKTGATDKRAMTMTAETARKTLASDVFVEQQREVVRVNQVPSPVWRQSGPGINKIELLPDGYDAESRTYTIGVEGVTVRPDVPLEEAVRYLREDLLKEFPFGGRDEKTGLSRDLAVHVAAMLSVYAPALVPLVAARPGVLWMANAARTGKTLLAKTAQIPVFGTASVTAMKTDEEFDKVLDTAAIEAWAVLFLDNLTGLLKSPTLDAFMTSPTRKGRAMGGQSSFVAQRVTQVLITGNNLGLSEDLEERFLICELFLQDMDPRTRKIERRMDEGWLVQPKNRSDILSALWALVRSWDEAGRPMSKVTIPGFETWSEVYGGIVEHAGFGSPLARPSLAYGGNDWKRDLMVMLEALADDITKPEPGEVAGLSDPVAIAEIEAEAKKRTSKDFTFGQLIDCCRELDCFTGAINGREGKDGKFEADAKTKSTLGKYFGGQFGGRIGELPDKRRVKFGTRGRHRHHRFTVELLP